jgi:hypothetical protein
MARMGGRSSAAIPMMVSLVIIGCARSSRAPNESEKHYVVTGSPIEVGVGSGLCIALDLNDQRGVWWWQPGDDCSKRTTGPGVFPAEQAAITRGEDAKTADVRFRVQVHRAPDSSDPPYVEIRLALKDGRLGSPGTGAWVNTITRRDLEIPEMWR